MGKICCSLCRNLFFPVLILFKHKKTQYESHPIFPFSDGFHKLELCIGLNPFFFLFFCFTLGYFVTFSWVHTFAFLVYGVIRYVLGGPSSLSVFFFRFLLFTLLYQFSHRLSILYFDFLSVFHFYSVSYCAIIFIFRLLWQNIPAEPVSKRIRQGHFHDFSLFLNQQGFSCHFFWLLHSHQLDQGRCDVCQASALS